MANSASSFHQAHQRKGVPMRGRLQVGCGLVWVLGLGEWRMSQEPINRSLTKHLGEISHALLASCTEDPLSCSLEMAFLMDMQAKKRDEGHHTDLEEREMSAVHGKCKETTLQK